MHPDAGDRTSRGAIKCKLFTHRARAASSASSSLARTFRIDVRAIPIREGMGRNLGAVALMRVGNRSARRPFTLTGVAMDNDFWPTTLRRASGSVFHYTSGSGLLAIAPSGKVRASEASSLNDLAEVRQGWEAIARILPDFKHSDGRDLLTSLANDPLKAPHEVFMLCGSTAGDDANQWRLYADGGKGYALELDGTVQLCVYSSVESKHPTPPSTSHRVPLGYGYVGDSAEVTPWLHVLYTDPEIEDALAELLATVDAAAESIKGIDDDNAREAQADYIRDSSYGALTAVAHLIKSPGFRGENEVRVVATFVFGSDKVAYRPGGNGIVGYATLTQAPSGDGGRVLRPVAGKAPTTTLPLQSIRLGPLLSEEHEKTVTGFLRSCGRRRVAVTRSQVPLR